MVWPSSLADEERLSARRGQDPPESGVVMMDQAGPWQEEPCSRA